jgi:geranylgeranyl reductase family protein
VILHAGGAAQLDAGQAAASRATGAAYNPAARPFAPGFLNTAMLPSDPSPPAMPSTPASPNGAALPLPGRCDVLVVGAGPAGSACALWLARAGLDVVLADQHRFPRDKVCGDGLIPDAHAALRRLGVYDEVAAQAQLVRHVRCIGPRGGHTDVPGQLSVLPRKQLDHILCRAAERAGARLLAPARFEAPLLDGERVVGARLRCGDAREQVHEISARWVVLATGAVPQALTAAGLCERHTPSGVALRGYYRHDGLRERITQLQIVWHPRLRGGYGWIFPAPGGLFNIGTGLTASHRRGGDGKGHMRDNNLRAMLSAFAEVYAPAQELLAQGEPVGEIKGAPLRFGLCGARWSRPGLLAAGEAIGSTYSFSGEGIGKAMETGLLAAEALLHDRKHPAAAGAAADASIAQRYAAALGALQPRFDIYQAAANVNDRPWLVDLVVWRARKSPEVMRKLAGVLDETHTPRLFSWRGVARLMFQ